MSSRVLACFLNSPVPEDGPLESNHHLNRLDFEQSWAVRAQQNVQRRPARWHLHAARKPRRGNRRRGSQELTREIICRWAVHMREAVNRVTSSVGGQADQKEVEITPTPPPLKNKNKHMTYVSFMRLLARENKAQVFRRMHARTLTKKTQHSWQRCPQNAHALPQSSHRKRSHLLPPKTEMQTLA